MSSADAKPRCARQHRVARLGPQIKLHRRVVSFRAERGDCFLAHTGRRLELVDAHADRLAAIEPKLTGAADRERAIEPLG